MKSRIDDLIKNLLDSSILRSSEYLNKLLNIYCDGDRSKTPRLQVINRFVADTLALTLPLDHSKLVKSLFASIQDPLTQTWLLQLSFFIQLRSFAGVNFGYQKSTRNWPYHEIETFEGNFPVLNTNSTCWYAPIASTESLLYALYFDGAKSYLRIVIFAHEDLHQPWEKDQHKQQIQMCEKILEQVRLSNQERTFRNVEVFYVVNIDSLKEFEMELFIAGIIDISGKSMKGKELEKVNVIGIEY
jgi:hypothetical protein